MQSHPQTTGSIQDFRFKQKNNNKQQPSNQTKYATRSTTRKKEQNNALTYTNKHDSSGVETEINHIEEIFELQEPSLGNNNIGTEVLIQGIATNNSGVLAYCLLFKEAELCST
jgi:hypothetical protein